MGGPLATAPRGALPLQVQFLYASLGSGGSSGHGSGSAASWRSALAALKSDYEKHFKYTGKV